MNRLFLPLILFMLVVLEGVAVELLPEALMDSDLLITPHWVLIALLFISISYDRIDTYHSVFYALIFGLLIDIVYTGILGVYMFTYAIVTYFIHGLMKLLHSNFYVTILMSLLGISLADMAINVIYQMVGLSNVYWSDYFTIRLLPSLIANLIFILIMYPLMIRLLRKLKNEHFTGST